jgi:hypothetical protein
MVSLKGQKAHRSFLKKGFKDERDKKHIFYYFYFNGKKSTIYTKMSHNPGDLNDYLIGRMADQLKLEKNDFVELVKCPLLEENLIEIYKQKSLI